MSIQREQILACACDLYLKGGLEGVSMRRLAREVGVTAPAIYRHFEGKEDVLLGVVGEAYKTLAQYLHRALSGATPTERFRMAGEAYLDFALEHPRYYEMIHAPVAALGVEEMPDELQARACAIGQFWHDRLRETMDEGLIRQGDPEEIGVTMWAHAHGLISLYLRGMMRGVDEDTFRKLYRVSSRRVMGGIGVEGWEGIVQAEEERSQEPAGADSGVGA